MQRHVTPYRLAVVGLLSLLTLVVALNGWGHFYTDTKPEVYLAPGRALRQSVSAWIPSPYLGAPSFNVGYLPVLVVTAALRGLGLSPEWTYKLVHLAVWALTAWGTARLARRLLPRAGRWTALAAGVLVLVNPYTIQAGGTLAVALPMAVLPWNLLVFVQALRERGHGPWWHWSRWCRPAAFALTFFAMSGMNAAVVPIFQLLALVPICWLAVRAWSVRPAALLGVLVRCGLLTLLVSAYWLVPAVGAITTGQQIVSASETLTNIASVSSYPEVLRGLGLWPLYGRDSRGPWVPQDTVYITSTPVMLVTMAWSALALLGLRFVRGRARQALALTIALAAVIMVGIFPAQGRSSSPFGLLLGRLLQLPGFSAFRTTNKVGAVLVLGLTLALAAGAVALARRFAGRSGLAPLAAGAAVMVLLVWGGPAFAGRLYTSPMDIPGYWRQAARQVDAHDAQSAVLMLPGQTQSDYRWTVTRPDDVPNSLFTRQVVLPETTPNQSAAAANFLQALDGTVQNGVVPAGTISTFARYLGASTVLVRHDTVWEDFGGARPAQLEQQAQADRGLVGAGNFGRPGEFVLSNTQPVVGSEVTLSPLQQYSVTGAQTTVRAAPSAHGLIVAGDGWALPPMVSAGLLTRTPTLRYAQDLSAPRLASSLRQGQTMVLTDTNQRRAAILTRLSNNRGPLLAAGDALGQSRVLGDRTADQTVLERSGPRVTATSSGSIFFQLPNAAPENALDDSGRSAWLFGDFGRAVGQRLTITEPTRQALHRVRIKQAAVGGRRIDKVTVQAGGRSVSTRLPDNGYGSVDLGGIRAGKVTVTVNSLRGDGYNLVGISDIQLPGGRAQRIARLPQTLTDRYHHLNAAQRRTFDRTPLDVLMRRDQGTDSVNDDPETQLRRVFSLPDARSYDPSATVRVTAAPEPTYDALAGYSTKARATSSGFYFQVPANRASSAADGRAATAWVPGGDLRSAWWQLSTAPRDISSVAVRQRATDGPGSGQRWADRVTITVDGRAVASKTLKHGGTTMIRFPKTRGAVVRMAVDSVSGPAKGRPPSFPAISTGATLHRAAGAAARPCVSIATMDGRALRMRPVDATFAGPGDQGTTWRACGKLSLPAGQHVLAPADGFLLDGLSLKDRRTPERSAAAPAVGTRIERSTPTHKSVTVRSHGPFAVVLGQSFNTDWTATANGRSLGRPQLIDGYSTGWFVPSGGTYRLRIDYAPQRRADLALGVSLVTLLACAALAGLGLVRRPSRPRNDDAGGGALPAGAGGAHAVAARRHSGVLAGLLHRRGVREALLVAAAGFFVGWGGLAAAVAVVALQRVRPVPAWVMHAAGAVLLLVAMVVYLLVLGDARGQVDAGAISRSLWPNSLAGAALVIGLVGAMRGERSAQARPASAPHEDSEVKDDDGE